MSDNKNKNKYDLTVMLPEEDTSFVEDVLNSEGAEDIEKKVTKVNFAYEISDKEQGYMAVFKFAMNPDSTKIIDKKFRTEPSILRYLLLRDTLTSKEESKSKTSKESKSSSDKKSKKKSDDMLTNEAIEKKIEEITS